MVFRIELNIHDPILIEALTRAKRKKTYLIEKALTYYLLSKSGKELVESLEVDEKKIIKKDREKVKEKKKKKEITFDKFL